MSSPEGDIMDMDDVFGISVHNSMENPETFSPTRISTVLFLIRSLKYWHSDDADPPHFRFR